MKIVKRLSWTFVAVILLAACTEVEDITIEEPLEETAVTEETQAKKEAEEKAKAAAQAKKEAEEKAAEEKAKVAAAAQQSVLEQEMLAIYQQNMPMVSVTFDAEHKAYMMIPTDPAFIAEIYATLAGTLDISHWNNLVSSFATASATQQQNLGSGYKISLQNPANPDNTILILVDGEVFYDAFNE